MTDAALSTTPPPAAATPARRKKRRFSVVLASTWLLLVALMALFGGLLDLPKVAATVGAPYQPPQWGELATLLGTDAIGRSELSRLVQGARVSGMVGVLATLLSLVVGVAIGLISAYFTAVDKVTAIVIDVMLAVPPLILLIALAAVMDPSLVSLILVLGLLGIPTFSRMTRANALQALGQEYVTAARALGASTPRLLIKEVLPNALIPMTSFAVIVAAVVMVAEGSLSFLGLGIPPPTPSWGSMIAAGQPDLATHPSLVLIPTAALFLTVFSLNCLGDALRVRIAGSGD